MQKFHDYAELSEQIHAPDDLKARVLRAARTSRDQAESRENKKSGKYSRGFSFVHKAAVAAILAICIPVTAYAAARYFGLLDHLAEIGFQNAQEVQALVETFPSEAGTAPVVMENGDIKIPEFRVTEALCDSESLYVAVEIKPMDDRYLLVPSELDECTNVESMDIPGVSGMSIGAYADSLGKEILLVGAHLSNDDPYGVSAGLISKCTADGTVYQYFAGENPGGLTEFTLTVTCLYHTLDMPLAERFTFDIPITNKSEGTLVKTFTQFEDTGLDLTLHSLTIEETALGYYATLTYSTTDGMEYAFDLMNAEGEFLKPLPTANGPFSEAQPDGTRISTYNFQKIYALDGLQFQLTRGLDFEDFGPFKILG